MKKLIIYCFLISLVVGCNKNTDENFGKQTINESDLTLSGKDLFNGKGTCVACHLTDKKVIGPSIQEISAIYKEKGASIACRASEDGNAWRVRNWIPHLHRGPNIRAARM